MEWKELINLREARNLKQKDVANALGISFASYSRWESGTVTPKIKDLIRLADYFQVSTDYLLGRSTDSITISLEEYRLLKERSKTLEEIQGLLKGKQN